MSEPIKHGKCMVILINFMYYETVVEKHSMVKHTVQGTLQCIFITCI